MNPAMLQLLASALSKMFQGGMATMYARPAQALPLDYTAAARAEDDQDREYMMSEDEYGVGRTNLGRMLLPKDAMAFDRLERGPERFERMREAVLGGDRRYQGRFPGLGLAPSVVANAPGEQDVPVGPDMSWALHRLKQASAANLIDEVPTPDDRDLPRAWRDTSAQLAAQAKRQGFDLTGRLQGKLDPQMVEALSRALKGIW